MGSPVSEGIHLNKRQSGGQWGFNFCICDFIFLFGVLCFVCLFLFYYFFFFVPCCCLFYGLLLDFLHLIINYVCVFLFFLICVDLFYF
jgi:hypothetical protein